MEAATMRSRVTSCQLEGQQAGEEPSVNSSILVRQNRRTVGASDRDFNVCPLTSQVWRSAPEYQDDHGP